MASIKVPTKSLRLGNRLILEQAIDSGLAEALIPPFSLQPLVENAVQHGLQSSPQLLLAETYSTPGSPPRFNERYIDLPRHRFMALGRIEKRRRYVHLRHAEVAPPLVDRRADCSRTLELRSPRDLDFNA